MSPGRCGPRRCDGAAVNPGEGPRATRIIGAVALFVAIWILIFFAIGFGLGKLFV